VRSRRRFAAGCAQLTPKGSLAQLLISDHAELPCPPCDQRSDGEYSPVEIDGYRPADLLALRQLLAGLGEQRDHLVNLGELVFH
jgi:hypothetical protein